MSMNRTWFVCAAAVAAAVMPLLSSAQSSSADLDALVKAAKAEGEVVLYSAPTENVARRVSDAFTAKYGIKVSFLRLASQVLQQRHAAEAESGSPATDLFINSGGLALIYAEESIKKGWLDPISTQNLPAMRDFPKRWVTGPTAIVQIAPWALMYNTNKMKQGQLKDWTVLLDPKLKGQVLLSDPRVSSAYLEFWTALLSKYGEDFFVKLRPNLRQVATGVQAAQGVGAGEGIFLIPAVVGQIQQIKEKGAPINWVMFDYTTAVQQHLLLTARGKSKHPAAGRLLANYLMSPEGNKVLNDEPGGFTVYETDKAPKQLQSPQIAMVLAKQRDIVRLLGF